MGETIAIILLLYLVIQVVRGYRKGFLKSALSLAAWILTFAIAYYTADLFKGITAQYIVKQPQNFVTDQIAYVIAFALITIIVRILFGFLIHFINKINQLPGIGFVNKLAGGIHKRIFGDYVRMFFHFLDAEDRIKFKICRDCKTGRYYGNADRGQSVYTNVGRQHRN